MAALRESWDEAKATEAVLDEQVARAARSLPDTADAGLLREAVAQDPELEQAFAQWVSLYAAAPGTADEIREDILQMIGAAAKRSGASWPELEGLVSELLDRLLRFAREECGNYFDGLEHRILMQRLEALSDDVAGIRRRYEGRPDPYPCYEAYFRYRDEGRDLLLEGDELDARYFEPSLVNTDTGKSAAARQVIEGFLDAPETALAVLGGPGVGKTQLPVD